MPLLNDTLLSDVALKTLCVLPYEASLEKSKGLSVLWGATCAELTGRTPAELGSAAALRELFGRCFQDWLYNLTLAATQGQAQEWTHSLNVGEGCLRVSHRLSPLGKGKVLGCILGRGGGNSEIASRESPRDSGQAGDGGGKAKFISAISHEIRTPMNAIVGISHLALSTTQDPVMRNYLKKIDHSATCLMALLNDIMDYAKIDADNLPLEHDCFRIADVLRRLKAAFAPMALEKRLDILLEVSEDVPAVVKGDSLRISQVLTNLLGNALLFSGQGVVRLQCSVAEVKENRLVLRFIVQDNSRGMSIGQLENEFTAFHQADSASTLRYGGTGLGLSLSRKLAEVLGGCLTVANVPGGAHKLIFTCLVERESADARADGLDSLIPRFQGQTVLLVEDNATNQEIATTLMEAANLKVVCADNGQAALEILNKKQDRGLWALVLMDLQMPVMDGYQATEAIRSDPRWKSLPIIALTAYTSEAERRCCLKTGMQGHLPKPIDAASFFELLEQYLALDPAARLRA